MVILSISKASACRRAKAAAGSMLILLSVNLLAFAFSVQMVKADPNPVECWAVLVSVLGNDSEYGFHALDSHYAFSGIYHLYHTNSSAEFQQAMSWLNSKSDYNDICFIYVVGHGGGIAFQPEIGGPWWMKNYNGIYDYDKDEWYNGTEEINESLVDFDFDGDGYKDDNVGVDESLRFNEYDIVTDDWLSGALPSSGYGTLIFATQQCMGGGVIDDLSATNRIIMTAVDETHLAAADLGPDVDGYSEWSASFFDALHGENTKRVGGEVFHTGEKIDADINNDGQVSILEAFKYSSAYTKNNVTEAVGYPQIPWLDDNGDQLPTFSNQMDIGNEIDDGVLAASTFFPMRYYNLTIRTCDIGNDEFSGANVWIDDVLMGSSRTIANVSSGHIWHKVTVDSGFYIGHYYYTLSHWDDDSTGNSRFVHLDNNTTITAYYNKTFINHPPETPSTPSGYNSGYVYQEYEYSTSTTDLNGDDIRYEFDWNDGSITIVPQTGYCSSGTQAQASHIWTRPKTYQLGVRAQDTYAEWSETATLMVSITQNDANKGIDAGNSFSSATSISSGTYKGTLYQSNPTDPNDYYRFSVQSGQLLTLSMTPPSGVNFDLELYNPAGSKKAESHNGAGYTESISYVADSSGSWRIRIFRVGGEGQYSFSVSIDWAGGCPYVSTWNGNEFILDNNLIAAAEVSGGTDVVDYYMLQQPLIFDEGKYSLLISDVDKHSYIDRVQLIAVDHDTVFDIAVTPYGEILTYRNPQSPQTAMNRDNYDLLDLIERIDDLYYEGLPDDYITLDFGQLDITNGAKLVIRTDPPSCPVPCKLSISVQVLKPDGWTSVACFIPRMYWSIDILDLSDHLPDVNGELKVRFYFTGNHRIDYIGLDTTKQEEIEVRQANLASATHSVQGNIRQKLVNSDNLYTGLLPSEKIILHFTLPQNQEDLRNFIVIVEGHYHTLTDDN